MGSIGKKSQPELKGAYADCRNYKDDTWERIVSNNETFTFTYKGNKWKRIKK